MAECSLEERAFLDAVASGENIGEARKRLFLARLPGPLLDAAVSARVMWQRSGRQADEAFEACAKAKCNGGVGSKQDSLERGWLYDEIDAEIERRRAELRADDARAGR